jgi:cobalt-zinc-cadmium efflux system protein
MSGHTHTTGHAHGHDPVRQQRGALVFSIGANTALLVVQVVVGLVIGSLALLADSLHNASDVVALVIALVGQLLAGRPATRRRSYGMARAEILAALLNGAVLIALTAWVVVEAIGRLGDPPELDAAPLAAIGLVGLAVNGGSAWYLSRTSGSNLNIRAAFWHLMADALGSFGVVVAAAAVWLFDAAWADPAVSILISVLILAGVWQLMKETVGVLLEATPRGIDPDAVQAALAAMPGVESVHHLHIWTIDSQTTALTGHLQLADGLDLHQAQQLADRCREMLHDRFEITHATLEPECHRCTTEEHDVAPAAAPTSAAP